MSASDKIKEVNEQAKKAAAKEKERIEEEAHKVEAKAKADEAKLHERMAHGAHHEQKS